MRLDAANPVQGVAPAVESLSFARRLLEVTGAFIQLTKPRIVLLFGLTGIAAMIMEGSLRSDPFRLWMLFLGMVLTAGSANALNQYYDRDIDAVMERTRKKRPLPSGKLSPQSALVFALAIGTLATWMLVYFGNWLAAGLGVGTIVYYVGIYTMWLKRSTPYNIVIGGAAGATAPLIGWAAATGNISLAAWIMFAIIFMWTPPHFWALALCLKDEYAGVSVPMLPVVKGEAVTRKQILWYSLALVPLTLTLTLTGDAGMIYFIAASALGALFIKLAFRVYKETDKKVAWKLFGYSIVYLLVLFIVMIIDSVSSARAAEPIPRELSGVSIEEHLGAQVDLNLKFRDEKGELVSLRQAFDNKHPVLLMMGYYGCPNLCNMVFNAATDSMKKLDWVPGNQFRVLNVSIDPREDAELATKKRAAHLAALDKPGAETGWSFWINDREAKAAATDTNVQALANQVGFGYKYDKDQDQYAHAAVLILLTPEGKISRYLYGIEFNPQDLRLGLVEAGGRKIGTMMDHILLFCYNYDPKTKKYALYATNFMRLGGGVTVLLVGGVLGGFWRRNRKKFLS